jgi:hypothetical protein
MGQETDTRTSCRTRPRSEIETIIGTPVGLGDRFAISKKMRFAGDRPGRARGGILTNGRSQPTGWARANSK